MPRDDQGFSGQFGPSPNKECGHGYCGGWHPSSLQNATVKVLGNKNWWVNQVIFNICYYPSFGGQERRLYRETRFVKMVTKADNSVNSLVYSREGDFSCLMLEEDQDYYHGPSFCQIKIEQPLESHEAGIWKLHFDRANSREGNGAGILLISPTGKWVPLSFKLEYEATIMWPNMKHFC